MKVTRGRRPTSTDRFGARKQTYTNGPPCTRPLIIIERARALLIHIHSCALISRAAGSRIRRARSELPSATRGKRLNLQK